MQGNRDIILDWLAKSPGASTREIATAIGVDDSTADYHLRRLLRNRALVRQRNGRTIAWFVKGSGYCSVLKNAVPLVRDEHTRRILSVLDEVLPATATGIAEATGLRTSAVRTRLQHLEDAGLIVRSQSGRVLLRDGASTCREKILSGETCGWWGACAVSRALGPTPVCRQDARATTPTRSPH